MRALLINAVCGIRSTGRICTDIAGELEAEGYEVKIAYGRETVPEQYEKYAVRIGNNADVYFHALMSKLFDGRGYWSKRATEKFLKWADEYDPDILWLHNLHDYYINIEMLFSWIKSRPQMKVRWTQHDCWAFTGGCSHFIMTDCYCWREKCVSCPKAYKSPHGKLICRTEENFQRKKAAFCGVENMEIVVVSKWLKALVKDSFLKEYPIKVEYNKVDKSVFCPRESDFREEHKIGDRKMILGAASFWTEHKGLDIFTELAKRLDDRFVIVLVGLNEKQAESMPANIIPIKRTNNAVELAEIYTAADLFLNPSREETFGMTTLEALCCGTPAVVIKGTACEEVILLGGRDNSYAVEYNADEFERVIYEICDVVPKDIKTKELAV